MQRMHHYCTQQQKNTAYQLIRERDVDKLVQPAWTENGGVNDVRSVGGTNDEHVLLVAHAVHLSEHLIDDTIGCTSYRSHTHTPHVRSNMVQRVRPNSVGGVGGGEGVSKLQ